MHRSGSASHSNNEKQHSDDDNLKVSKKSQKAAVDSAGADSGSKERSEGSGSKKNDGETEADCDTTAEASRANSVTPEEAQDGRSDGETEGGTNDDSENGGKNSAKDSSADKSEKSSSSSKKSDGANKSAKNGISSGTAAGTDGETTKNAGASAASSTSASSSPPPPLLKGTLSYNLETRRHILRGNWNYDYSNVKQNQNKFPPQRFDLIRNFPQSATTEEIKRIPQNGEFHGSFSLSYIHVTNKGKKRERSRVISEKDVKITFEPITKGDKQSSKGTDEDDDSDESSTQPSTKHDEYKVFGRGTNQFGVFEFHGTASRSKHEHENESTFNVELRKKYLSVPPAPSSGGSGTVRKAPSGDGSQPASKKSKTSSDAGGMSPSATNVASVTLQPPSQTFASNVVCLRGKLFRESQDELGIPQTLHRIRGMWSSGLDLLLADPENTRGMCNPFDYEHKSIDSKNEAFPLSGRYTGWFYLSHDDGSRQRISERDVTLKFKPNTEGNYNVEGRGSNGFGKYTITGQLTKGSPSEITESGGGWLITIFRHFTPGRKSKKDKSKGSSSKASLSSGLPSLPASALPGSSLPTPAAPSANSVQTPELPSIKLSEVVIPGEEEFEQQGEGSEESGGKFTPLPIPPPAQGTYSAVSRGVLRINADGAHTCGGKWAMTREHYTNGQTSNFHFGLEAIHAQEATKDKLSSEDNNEESSDPSALVFPVDSPNYKGSFKMRRGTTKYTSVIDRQVVLKFRQNSSGSYNVYGRGINSIGIFNLVGTLIPTSGSSGQVELYRMYPVSQPTPSSDSTSIAGEGKGSGEKSLRVPGSHNASPSNAHSSSGFPSGAGGVHHGEKRLESADAPSSDSLQSHSVHTLQRTESGRPIKLPTRLEESDPAARKARIMDKCHQLLRYLRDKDLAMGSFFAEPVDPVALGIPSYHKIISNPMDLGTIQTKLNGGEIDTHEDFARLVRLTFENAIKFNVDTTHAVHANARNLLLLFNRKYADLERFVASMSDKQGAKRLTKEEKKQKAREEKRREKEAKRKAKEEKQERRKRQKAMKAARQAAATAHPLHVGDEDADIEDGELEDAAAAAAEAVSAQHQPGSASGALVPRVEFDKLVAEVRQLKQLVVAMQKQLADSGVNIAAVVPAAEESPVAVKALPDNAAAVASAPVANTTTSVSASSKSSASKRASSKSKPTKKSPPAQKEKEKSKEKKPQEKQGSRKAESAPSSPQNNDDTPLTLKEQEVLTETINRISNEKLYGVIQIIRESTKLGDEEEIDLEIDQLDTATQRKLQRYVMQHVKPPRKKPAPKKAAPPKKAPTPAPARAPSPPSASEPAEKKKNNKDSSTPKKPPKKPSKPANQSARDSFIPFGKGSDSDSSSDEETEDDNDSKGEDSSTDSDGEQTLRQTAQKGKSGEKSSKGKGNSNSGNQDEDSSSDDDDDDDDLNEDIAAKNWNMAAPEKATEGSSPKSDDDDSDDDDKDSFWAAARLEAEASKEREADKRARQDKLRQKAELESKERLANAVATADSIRAKRMEEEEEEARLQEEKRKEAEEKRKEARDAVRRTVMETTRTVDIGDEQRDLMEMYERNFKEEELGGSASPSSDFGF